MVTPWTSLGPSLRGAFHAANLCTERGLSLAIAADDRVAFKTADGSRPNVPAEVERLTGVGPAVEGESDEAKASRERMRLAPGYRALRLMAAAEDLAARECLLLRVRDLPGLPVPFALSFRERRKGRPFALTTTRRWHEKPEAQGLPFFVARELDAASQAAEAGRANADDLGAWLDAKARGQWVLTPERARVAEMPWFRADGPGSTWTLGELCDALGFDLVRVEMFERKAGA